MTRGVTPFANSRANFYNEPMPDQAADPTPTQPAPTPAATPAPPSAPPPRPAQQRDFYIGDEFGTAKRNLPPAGIVLICIAAVAVVVALVSFQQRAKHQGGGSIDLVSAVEIPGQNMVLVAVTVTLRNHAKNPLWIHTLKAQLTDADGHTLEDEAASAIDLDRYFQAFPVLKESSEPPLPPETKLLPGASQRGTIMFSFPGTKEAFDRRKALAVAIQPYDQPLPVTLK
jgi:hypothetical protein